MNARVALSNDFWNYDEKMMNIIDNIRANKGIFTMVFTRYIPAFLLAMLTLSHVHAAFYSLHSRNLQLSQVRVRVNSLCINWMVCNIFCGLITDTSFLAIVLASYV